MRPLAGISECRSGRCAERRAARFMDVVTLVVHCSRGIHCARHDLFPTRQLSEMASPPPAATVRRWRFPCLRSFQQVSDPDLVAESVAQIGYVRCSVFSAAATCRSRLAVAPAAP